MGKFQEFVSKNVKATEEAVKQAIQTAKLEGQDRPSARRGWRKYDQKFLQELNNPDSINYSQMLDDLSRMADLRNGIVWQDTSANPSNGILGCRVRITDPDRSQEHIKRSFEHWARLAVGSARGIETVIDSQNIDSAKKLALKKQTRQRLAKTLQELHNKSEQIEHEIQLDLEKIYGKDLSKLSKKELKERDDQYAKLLNESQEEYSETIKMHGGAMQSILELEMPQMPEKELTRLISNAKELASFDDTHRHIATISYVKDDAGKQQIFVQAETALTKLTAEQVAQYQAIADNKTAIIAGTVVGSPPLPEWCKELEPKTLVLVAKYAEKIVKGDHVMPTQLADLPIPGTRNFYEHNAYVVGDDGKLENIVNLSHSGTPSGRADSKVESPSSVANTQLNIRQIEANSKDDAVGFSTLNQERKIVGTVQQGLKGTKSKLAISPTNAERFYLSNKGFKLVREGVAFILNLMPFKFAKKAANFLLTNMETVNRDHELFKNQLENVGKALKSTPGCEVITKYLQAGRIFGPNHKEAKEELAKLETTNLELAKELKTVIEAKAKLNSIAFSFSGNFNLEVAGQMAAVNSVIRKEGGALNNICKNASPTLKTHIFCQSGKDRTWMAILQADFVTMEARLGSKHHQQNMQAIASSGHAQYLAGVQGGTIGAEGLKVSAAPIVTLGAWKNFFDQDLSTEIAHKNHFKKSKYKQKEYQEKFAEQIKEVLTEQRKEKPLRRNTKIKALQVAAKTLAAKIRNRSKAKIIDRSSSSQFPDSPFTGSPTQEKPHFFNSKYFKRGEDDRRSR